jgi:dipeptidyl aminopeptidase/acylaminoacyl peptidase
MHRAEIDRRAVLRGATAIGFAAPFAALRSVSAATEPDPIPRRVLFDNPDYRSVHISPDGAHIAYLAPLGGVRNLWFAPTADPHAGRPLTHVADRDLSLYYRWAHTNRHIVFFQGPRGRRELARLQRRYRERRDPAVDAGARRPFLRPGRRPQVPAGDADPAQPARQAAVRPVPGQCGDRRERARFRKSRLRLAGHRQQFPAAARRRFVKDGSCEVFERGEEGGWTPFARIPIGDLDGTRFLNFSADGKTLYLRDSRDRDKSALVAVDMSTREKKILAEDQEADIVEVSFSGRRPVAAAAIGGRKRWQALDPATEKDLALLAAYGSGDIEFTGRSYGNRKVPVYFERDAASGEYVLLDREAGAVRPLYIQRKALNGLPLRPLDPVVIPARDGLKLNGYLARPANPAGGSKPPLVLVIHGGPYARDHWGFNPTHQWLADRGYAVLSVNYRGSTGFGKAFVTAADREWGGKMHDDLIDALDWAIAQGLGDPDRVGFFGGSYGGYSALMAATKTPERFACIVDLFGISNLITFMKTIPPYWGPSFSIWHNRVGDPETEDGRALLAERSPINHLDRATKPILIAQGMNDVRVVAAESEQMVRALKDKGVPVTYVTFRDEGHGFVRPANRLAFYAVAEAFLAKHLGGRSQPVGGDFAGSTIKVETGGELIPGLKA